MTSIRTHLKRRLAASLGAAWFISFLVAMTVGYLEYLESFDSRLAHTAQLMLSFVSTQPDIAFTNPSPEVLNRFSNVDDYIVIISRDERPLYSSIPLAQSVAAAFPPTGKTEIGGIRWKLLSYTDPASRTRVTLGVDIEEPLKSALEVAGISLLVFGIATGVVAVTVILSIRSGLAPLAAFAEEVRLRDKDNLTPLALEKSPQELHPIAHSLNGLMERLESAIKRERDFVGNAAHELRTPLAAIRAQIEATDAPALPPETAGRFGLILRATERAGRMISQLLDLSRSQSLGAPGAGCRDVDLTDLAAQVIAQLAPAALGRDVEIALDAPAPCRVRTKPDLLAIALRNLIENACKYCGEPGRVEFRIETGERTLIRISDNGPGLNGVGLEDAAAKFERLGRTDGGGAGLGLSIVTEIARHLGIELGEEYPGPLGGFSITLELP